jgi:1,4-alpha-glucan branching enzyme
MKTTFRLLGLLLVLLLVQGVQAQVVSWSPAFPTQNEPITITFDATKGTGGLANVTDPIYAHTGVLTNLSTSDSDWKYVKASWETNTPAALMTSLGNNLYQITINPRTYYNVPAQEEIKALMFVFRNASRTNEGKDTGGKDIKVPLFSSGTINVSFSQPTVGLNGLFVDANQTIQVRGNSSTGAKLSLYVNGVKVKEEAAATALEAQVTATTPGANKVKLTADNGTISAADSFTFVVRQTAQVEALPATAKDGVTYLSATSVLLNLYAPGKQQVYAVGDFNNWVVGATPLKRTPDGTRFWVQIDNLTAGQEYAYQYLVDETIRVGDPYTQKTLDPNEDQFIPAETYPNLKAYPTGKATGMVSVFQTNQAAYNWNVTNFARPKKTDLVIYELLVRDFLEKHDYKTLTDTLNYLKRLGVNAIELMPINEFEGNLSWGYNSAYYFAPDKYYGSKEMLKRFIDAAHARGMAVIMDIALNHSFGQSPMVQLYYNAATGKTTPESPWFNPDPTHDFNVGHDFNHESAATKYFVDRVTEFWLQEYKIDGYRFDLSKGFTQKQTLGNVNAWGQYDQSRIDLLKRMADHLWTVDNNAYVILEHFADNSEETVLANYGMMLWGNMFGNYKQAILGYTDNSNFNWISYKQRGWTNPHVVGFMESHDEERQMVEALAYGNSSGTYNVRNLSTALQRMQLAAAFFFTIPGPKMIWQFGELGYDIPINQNGRTGNKPILWNYYQDVERNKLYNVYNALIKLKINEPAFESGNYTLNLQNDLKTIHIQDPDMNVAVLGNFGVTAAAIDPKFQYTGTWYDYVTGASLNVTNVNQTILLQPGEYRVYTTKRLSSGSILLASKEERAALAREVIAFPNPTQTGDLTVRYQLVSSAEVSLQVYDQVGRLVSSQSIGKQAAGSHSVNHTLTTGKGSRLAPGIYHCKLLTGSSSKTIAVVVQ